MTIEDAVVPLNAILVPRRWHRGNSELGGYGIQRTRVFPVNAGLFVNTIVTNANDVFIFQKRDLLVTDIGTNGDPVTRIIVLEKPSTTIPSRSKLRVESRSIGFLTRPRQRQQLHITRYYTVRLRN